MSEGSCCASLGQFGVPCVPSFGLRVPVEDGGGGTRSKTLYFLLRLADTKAITLASTCKHNHPQPNAEPASGNTSSRAPVQTWWLPLPTTQSDRPRRLRLEAAYQVGAGSTRSRYRLTVQVKACLSWDADTPWNRPRGTACSESKACVDI